MTTTKRGAMGRRVAWAVGALVTALALANGLVEAKGASHIRGRAALGPADAIVVPGARVYADGRPSEMLADRLDAALALYRDGVAPRILVSGDHGTPGYDEVTVMARYLEARGVPAEHVFLDHAGFTTYDTMYRARAVFGVGRAVVVTQRFHLGRALFVASALGLSAEGVAADRRPYTRGSLVRSNVREVGARVKALAEVILHRPPRFLGAPLPIGGDGRNTRG